MKILRNPIFLILLDFTTINISWILFYFFRVESGFLQLITQPEFVLPMLISYLYWWLIFSFVGLYKRRFTVSRLEEFTKIFKTTFIGVLILFFIIFIDDTVHSVTSTQRYIILFYWIFLFIIIGGGRIIFRTYQRYLIRKGIGNLNTLVIGFNNRSKDVYDQITKLKALGLNIVGFIAIDDSELKHEYKGIKVLGKLEDIPTIVSEKEISEIIISIDKHQHEEMINILTVCDIKNVHIKIVPDLYEIISGQARTSQIYGIPLIEVMPQLMQEWEIQLKRGMDIVISILILVISSPVIFLTSIFIKLDSKGPILFKQIRVGKDGNEFKIYKFRSMRQDAEKLTGPVWSQKNDPRITRVGSFIRKVRIDEIPQFINVLKGEMSLVGPRPERPYFVEKLSKEIPFYKRRLNVRPGITGWAQVKHKYDETIEDVKKKVEYDLFYIENASIRMDLSILFRTVFVVLFGKGHFEK